MIRPRLLDLFCGAGGCAVGYHRAGFDVVGIDNEPQPRYPFPFHKGDALRSLRHLLDSGFVYPGGKPYRLDDFAVIHASPPCQAYTRLRGKHFRPADHPDLLAATRKVLDASGKRYVIENVAGAKLLNGIVLCGASFGLKVYRHRFFESNVWLWQPQHRSHREKCPKGGTRGITSGFICVAGSVSNVAYARSAMGIDWMIGKELAQAIPPAYTQFIGNQLRVFFRLTRHPQARRRLHGPQRLLAPVEVVLDGDRRRRVAGLLGDHQQGCAVLQGGADALVPNAVQAPALDAVALLEPAELVAQDAGLPGLAAGVPEDRCVCGHWLAYHGAWGWQCLAYGCRCRRFRSRERPQQRDRLGHECDHLRLPGEPPALVTRDDQYPPVQVNVGPRRPAQFPGANPRQSQEPQHGLELLIGDLLQPFQRVVGHFGPPLVLGIVDVRKRVLRDAFLFRRPIETRPDRVRLRASRRNALPLGMGLDEVRQMEGLRIGNRQVAGGFAEQLEREVAVGSRSRTVDAFRGTVPQVERHHVLNGERIGFPPFRGPEQSDRSHRTAPRAHHGRRLTGGTRWNRSRLSLPNHPAARDGNPRLTTLASGQAFTKVGCKRDKVATTGPERNFTAGEMS